MDRDQEARPPRADELRSAAEEAEQRAADALKRGDIAAGESAIVQARQLRSLADEDDRISAIEQALGIQED